MYVYIYIYIYMYMYIYIYIYIYKKVPVNNIHGAFCKPSVHVPWLAKRHCTSLGSPARDLGLDFKRITQFVGQSA